MPNKTRKTMMMDDFKDPSTDPDLSPLDMLAKVCVEIRDQERKNSISCIPKKPNLVLRIKHRGAKKTTEKDADECSKQECFPKEKDKPISVGNESMDSDVEDAQRKKDEIKKGKLPTISKTELRLNEDEYQAHGMMKRTDLKRSHADLIDDEECILDPEWVPSESFKKQKTNSKGCGSSKRHKPFKLKQQLSMGADTPPDLPQEFKNKISEMGGTEVTLIIQKSLYATDLNPQHNRLSMPLKQILKEDFLREGELRVLLKKQAIEVPLIQPSLQLRNVTLAKWDMPKVSGHTTSSYVLRSSWMKVVAANQLKLNEVVQVWSFRVQDELRMALVKV